MVLYGYYDHCHLGHYCSSALRKLLAQLSTTLQDVIIRIIPASHWSPFSLEESVDLSTIRRVFIEQPFPRLRAVTLQLHDLKSFEAHRDTLEKAFPELRKSGVLRVEVVSAGKLPERRRESTY